MKTKIIFITTIAILLLGVPGAFAINEVIVFDHTKGSWYVNHTWTVESYPPPSYIVDYNITVNGNNYTQTETYYNHTGLHNAMWSNITVTARTLGGNPVVTGEQDIFIGYSADPIPISMWGALVGIGLILSIVACVFIGDVMVCTPLGLIGVVAFAFSGRMITANGVAIYSGGVLVDTIDDVLVSQVVMLFGVFPLIVVIVSILKLTYDTIETKNSDKISDFGDEWG